MHLGLIFVMSYFPNQGWGSSSVSSAAPIKALNVPENNSFVINKLQIPP